MLSSGCMRAARIAEHVHQHRPRRHLAPRQHRLGRPRDEDHGACEPAPRRARAVPCDRGHGDGGRGRRRARRRARLPRRRERRRRLRADRGHHLEGEAPAVARGRAARGRARDRGRVPGRRGRDPVRGRAHGTRERGHRALPAAALDPDRLDLRVAQHRDGGAGRRLRGAARAARRRRGGRCARHRARERHGDGALLRAPRGR